MPTCLPALPILQPIIDETAMAAHIVSNDQWIGFDNLQTLYMKIKAAEALGLGGLMVGGWLAGRVGGWAGG
jgi:hypothetical protein